MILLQYPQDQNSLEIQNKILELEYTAWPPDGPGEAFPSAPETHAASFLLLDPPRAICHVGVRRSLLRHRGKQYLAYGLSEVVTHPAYRRMGLASRLIQKAKAFMMLEHADLSIFTCAPERISFYARLGWAPLEGACFVGDAQEGALKSDSLGLCVMALFLSPHARANKGDFCHTELVFSLGEGQLW